MDEVSKLLVRRYADILRKRGMLQSELSMLDAERDKIIIAANAIELDLDGEVKSKPDYLPVFLHEVADDVSEKDTITKPTEITMKDAALNILKEHPSGLTANQILEAMRLRYNLVYQRSSLSPQLSRLKDEGKVTLDSGVWSLPPIQTDGHVNVDQEGNFVGFARRF